MWRLLKRLFARGDRPPQIEYDPIYGLSQRAVDAWLARNPKLKAEYEAELRSRAMARRTNPPNDIDAKARKFSLTHMWQQKRGKPKRDHETANIGQGRENRT